MSRRRRRGPLGLIYNLSMAAGWPKLRLPAGHIGAGRGSPEVAPAGLWHQPQQINLAAEFPPSPPPTRPQKPTSARQRTPSAALTSGPLLELKTPPGSAQSY